MALLQNLPKELSLIIDLYSYPIQCFHCEKMSFEIKSFAFNPTYKRCYCCFNVCDCGRHCISLPPLDIYEKESIHHDPNKYFPAKLCYYCDKIICMFCIYKIKINRYAIYNIYSCKNCLRKCKKCHEIINEYHTYYAHDHERCSRCDGTIDRSRSHCIKCDICLNCTMPGLEETL